MRTRCVCVPREKYSQPRSLSRDALLRKSGAGIAHTDDRFLSLLRRPRPRPRSVNNRSTGESYHAACLVSIRAHRRRNFTFTLYRRFTDDIHYPLAAIPFAERIARLFFSSLLRGALRHSRHFLLAVRIVPTFHLTHQSCSIHLCATISVDQWCWSHVARPYVHTSVRTWVILWTEPVCNHSPYSKYHIYVLCVHDVNIIQWR